jgi:uncharacterized membrane protein
LLETLRDVSPADWCALGLFLAAWLLYHPLFPRFFKRGTNYDMRFIRKAWMHRMIDRDVRLMDANLIGHTLSTASFFASTNLLIIAAVAGALFSGRATWATISDFSILASTSLVMFDFKLALIAVTLARGLLDFIWGARQLNYFLAVLGATPEIGDPRNAAYADAAAALLDPALQSVNKGVRGYYSALAAGAWLFGPYAAIAATIGAVLLLVHRQLDGEASRAIARARAILEEGPR